MKITALQEYGLRILMRMAEEAKGTEPIRIRTIAEKEALSVDYVEKILTRLRKIGFVKSVRGLKGGYILSSRPEKISLGSAVMALTEKPIRLPSVKKDLCGQFPGKQNRCVHMPSCTIRQVWSLILSQLYANLNKIYLSDLIGDDFTVQNRLLEIMKKNVPETLAEMESARQFESQGVEVLV